MDRRRSITMGLGAMLLLATGWIPASFSTSGPHTAAAQGGVGPVTPIALATCYGFSTVDKGEYSQFGYYCGGPIFDSHGGFTRPPCYSDVAHPAFEGVFRDACTFADFWVQHSNTPVPAIDFTREAVIVVVGGSRPNGCYGMEITAVHPAGCGVKVHIRERIPCPGELCTLALTNPYHIIRICKDLIPFEKPLCFEHRLSEMPNCGLYLECARPIDDEVR